uniref:tRNA (cytosine(34)-C(5))-methyltransferase n=1 Tax=Octopus bimaculoides TaxID=37653 RepID=A0A0L8FHP0_OCTBM
MEWYPDELGWQLNFSRKEVRNNTALEKLHKFLISETESGNISRQEAVSMIPPILLDVKPHHKVLDLCAAPGSKTAQLIEFLHADENKTIPDGFVVANDVDNKRCYMMVHQVKRLQSPCCVVVNHDAATMPNLRMSPNSPDFVSYDRVLADVPCSGDGTLRKNLDVWDTWHPAHGPTLHGLQARILKRGLELLTVGGRLVYSTCSFNPVENEAVVVDLLQRCEGALELVDVSECLKGLKAMPGLLTWRCMSRSGDWYDKYEEVPPKLLSQLRPSMFPPSEEITKQFNLNRCLRVLPHHQNTGGFFIAVMMKKQQLPWLRQIAPTKDPFLKGHKFATDNPTEKKQDDTNISQSKTDDGQKKLPEEVSGGQSQTSEEGVVIEKTNTEIVSSNQNHNSEQVASSEGKSDKEMSDKSGGDSNASAVPHDSTDKAEATSQEKRKLENDRYFCLSDFCNYNLINCVIINVGVKMFGRSPSPLVPQCDFRINQEGLACLHQYFPLRRVTIAKEDVITLLGQENPYLSKLSDVCYKQVTSLEPGSCIFIFEPTESDPQPECQLIFCGWKGKTSVRSFVGKHERAHYLRLCGVEFEDLRKEAQAKTEQNTENMDNVNANDTAAVDGNDSEEEIEKEDAKKVKPDVKEEEEIKKEGVKKEKDSKDGLVGNDVPPEVMEVDAETPSSTKPSN